MIPIGSLGGGTTFDATKYSGLSGWWDVSQLSGYVDNQTISNLPDLSSSGRAFGGSVATYKPGVRNGLPVARCTGSFSNSSPQTGLDHTLIVVGYFPTNAGSNIIANGSTSGYAIYVAADIRIHYMNVTWAGTAAWSSQWARVIMTGTSGTDYLYKDNGIIVSGSWSPNTPNTSMSLGYSGVDLCEALMFNRVINSTERSEIDVALAQKWGF